VILKWHGVVAKEKKEKGRKAEKPVGKPNGGAFVVSYNKSRASSNPLVISLSFSS
jgi:hypothetical protein